MRILLSIITLALLGVLPLAQASDRKADIATAVESVKDQIRAAWELPPVTDFSPKDKQKSVQLRIDFNPDGSIQSHRIVRSSGDKAFDDSLMAAVIKAQPLKVPAIEGDPLAYMEFLFTHYQGAAERVPAKPATKPANE